jgi:hypothetical protein
VIRGKDPRGREISGSARRAPAATPARAPISMPPPGQVSITPLQVDLTHREQLDLLGKDWHERKAQQFPLPLSSVTGARYPQAGCAGPGGDAADGHPERALEQPTPGPPPAPQPVAPRRPRRRPAASRSRRWRAPT